MLGEDFPRLEEQWRISAAAMCDSQMICDILWEGRILLLSQNLRFKLRRARETQTHMRKRRPPPHPKRFHAQESPAAIYAVS